MQTRPQQSSQTPCFVETITSGMQIHRVLPPTLDMAGLYIVETLYVWPRLTPGKPAAFIDEVGIGVVVRAFAWMDAPKPDPSKDQSFKRVTRPNFDRLRHMEPSGKVSQLIFLSDFFQIQLSQDLTRCDKIHPKDVLPVAPRPFFCWRSWAPWDFWAPAPSRCPVLMETSPWYLPCLAQSNLKTAPYELYIPSI